MKTMQLKIDVRFSETTPKEEQIDREAILEEVRCTLNALRWDIKGLEFEVTECLTNFGRAS